MCTVYDSSTAYFFLFNSFSKEQYTLISGHLTVSSKVIFRPGTLEHFFLRWDLSETIALHVNYSNYSYHEKLFHFLTVSSERGASGDSSYAGIDPAIEPHPCELIPPWLPPTGSISTYCHIKVMASMREFWGDVNVQSLHSLSPSGHSNLYPNTYPLN